MPTLEKHVVVITVAVLHLEGVLLHGTVATAKITWITIIQIDSNYGGIQSNLLISYKKSIPLPFGHNWMLLKRAIIKHTDHIHNWQRGAYIVMRTIALPLSQEPSRHLPQLWLQSHCKWSWQRIGWGTARSLWKEGAKSGENGSVRGQLGTFVERGQFPCNPLPPPFELTSLPLQQPPPIFFYTPWRPASLRVPDTLEGWPWESHYANTKVWTPTATSRTTSATTLNLTTSRPPLMHLHTEDRPNKVINQRPIFKWFAGRLKPLRTPPQVNAPTCRGADTILISGHRHCVHRTPRYKYIYRLVALPKDELPQYINIHMLISHMPKAN